MLQHKLIFCAAVLANSAVFAQSSGSFAATIDSTQCTVSTSGTNGKTITSITTTIQTPSSGSTALLITPSAVTGLYTDSVVTVTNPDTTATGAVVASVKFDGAPVKPSADTGFTDSSGKPLYGIVYDSRSQELSTNIFTALAAACSSSNNCFIDLKQGTMSAHSMNFVVPNPNANGSNNHTLEVDFSLVPGTMTSNGAAACVGPGTLTVQQVKTFQTSGGIAFQ